MGEYIMSRKKVYLTIDDGPSKDFKEKVDFLYLRGIPAVFFCLGENLEKQEEDVLYAIRKGFTIGNHSYKHMHFSDMNLEECKESILKTDEIIEIMYQRSCIKRPTKLFRFPHFDQGGDNSGEAYENKWSKPESEWFIYEREDKRTALQFFLRGLGYTQPQFKEINMKFFNDKTLLEGVDVRCTFDQMEYYLGMENAPYGMSKEETILQRINEDVPYGGRTLKCLETSDIILVHDQEGTSELFYKIINRYQEKKFEFLKI